MVLAIGFAVVMLVACGRLLKKAGHNPWKILIPIYGGYLLYKIADAEGVFWGTFALSFVAGIISGIVTAMGGNSYSGARTAATVVLVLNIIVGIIALILQYVYAKKMADSFGKSGGFAAGLFFLAPIFIMILAFGSAQYVGYKGLEAVPAAVGTWKCPGCGTENPVSQGICSQCGAVRPR